MSVRSTSSTDSCPASPPSPAYFQELPNNALDLLARAAFAPPRPSQPPSRADNLLEQCLQELSRCSAGVARKSSVLHKVSQPLEADLLPLVAKEAEHLTAIQALLASSRDAARAPEWPSTVIQRPETAPCPASTHGMFTRGLDKNTKHFQSTPIRFTLVVQGPTTPSLYIRLQLINGNGILANDLLVGTTMYPVPVDGQCLVNNTSVSGLSSKNGGSFSFHVQVHSSNGTVVAVGITPHFQVSTKRLMYHPTIDRLKPSDSVKLLPSFGHVYAQKIEEACSIVTIGDLAEVDPSTAPVICAKIRKERGSMQAGKIVKAIQLARDIVARSKGSPDFNSQP